MSATALAIFVKTPGVSPVKTRLAAGIGRERAERFYRLSLACAEELALTLSAGAEGLVTPFWAVGEEECLDHPLWGRFDRVWTGPGGLGERQDHVYFTLRQDFDRVIFMGADSPQLMPATILQTIRALTRSEGFVLGPTDDGGYYLFGGARLIPMDVWTGVTYSQSGTMQDLALRLARIGPLDQLPRGFDIDTGADLSKLAHASARMIRPAQKKLLSWLASEGLGGEGPG